MVATSTSMKNVINQAAHVAQSETTVLITGESGTGKDLLAKGIHLNSPRKNKPFITVNCPSIPENLIESELFGHVKGSFTGAVGERMGKFEQAQGGTLFLDEIGDLQLQLQSKLLRVLQNRTIERIGGNREIDVDVRIIAATNQNLDYLLEQGKFREDLYYRLNVVPIHIPPLREHPEDIPFLINYFLHKSTAKNIIVSDDALSLLQKYHWPGNVRELENLIARILVFLDKNKIAISDLPLTIVDSKKSPIENGLIPLARAEQQLIEKALQQSGGNKSEAARLLEIPRHVLLYRLKKFGPKP